MEPRHQHRDIRGSGDADLNEALDALDKALDEPESAPKTNGAFDLSSFDAVLAEHDAGRSVEIKNPVTGEATGVCFVVAGPESKRFRESQDAALTRRITAKQLSPVDAEEAREENIRIFSSSVLRWSTNDEPHVLIGGKPHECTPANVRMVFKRWPFIFDQVAAAWRSDSVFTKP